MMSNGTGITGNLCNKGPKWLVEQNNSYSDYFNAISGFTSNSRAPGGPVTFWHPIWDQRLPKLLKLQNVTFCPKCVKTVKKCAKLKMTKTALLGLANKVPVRECDRVFCECQSVSPGPGALPSLPQPSPADSSQVRAQESCPAAQRFRESAYHSGSFPESLQGPRVLLSAQGCAQVKPRPCAPSALRNCAQDGKTHVSRDSKKL